MIRKMKNSGWLIILIFSIGLNVSAQKTIAEEPGQQFVYRTFMKSTILMKNGDRHDYMLNYNMLSGRMVYLKDETMYDMIVTERIDTVYIANSRFIPAGNFFYEVVRPGKLAFYYHHKAELSPAGNPVGYGGRSQTSPATRVGNVDMASGHFNMDISAEYVLSPKSVFLLKKNDEFFSFRNEKQFLKLFPENESELKKYIKDNRIRFEQLADVAKLAGYVNDLTQ